MTSGAGELAIFWRNLWRNSGIADLQEGGGFFFFRVRNFWSEEFDGSVDSKRIWSELQNWSAWLHLLRAPGVVMTTSVLLGWWMLLLFYGVGRWTIIYILGSRHKHVRPLSPSYPNITFPTLVGYLHRNSKKGPNLVRINFRKNTIARNMYLKRNLV